MTDAEIQAFIDYGDNKISLNRLAEITDINPFELIAAFKRYAGEMALVESQLKEE